MATFRTEIVSFTSPMQDHSSKWVFELCHWSCVCIPLTRNYYVQYIWEMSTVYRMFVFASLKSTKYSNTTKKYLLPYVCSSNRSTTLHFFSNDWECTKLTPCSDFAFLVFQTILKTSTQTPYEPNLNFLGSYLWRYFQSCTLGKYL